MKGMKVEGSEMMIPLFRGFLFLVLIILAFDTMLIKTSIFYIFLGPLAGICNCCSVQVGNKRCFSGICKREKIIFAIVK